MGITWLSFGAELPQIWFSLGLESTAQQQRVITQLLAERELLDTAQRERLLQLLLGRYAQEATEEELLHRK